jgi:hypothetical protein
MYVKISTKVLLFPLPQTTITKNKLSGNILATQLAALMNIHLT